MYMNKYEYIYIYMYVYTYMKHEVNKCISYIHIYTYMNVMHISFDCFCCDSIAWNAPTNWE